MLEIGIGSGLNLPFYSSAAQQVIGLDPSASSATARDAARSGAIPVDFIEGSAQAIPLETASVDTVVMTWTLCSIPDPTRALHDMRRVLRPSGSLLFVEHGRAPDPNVVRWQDRLTPIWKRLGGGCHLNRAMITLIEGVGFRLDRVATGYIDQTEPNGHVRGQCAPVVMSRALWVQPDRHGSPRYCCGPDLVVVRSSRHL